MMDKICYIVGAGEDCGLDFAPQQGDLVIAADGGYEKLQRAGICPNLVIGDFDSLGAAPKEKQVITLPTVKDVTDTWAAIEHARKLGYGRFHLYGCTGGRFDHTLANIQTAAALAEQGMECLIFDKTQIITALSGGTMEFEQSCEGFVSVFSYTEESRVTLQGLRYELEDTILTNRFPLGVSNEFTGRRAVVTVYDGIAVLVYGRKNTYAH
ncbi:MAG: thiamine diphosphokinase [Oscillospiraceae bacterium]|nr:thiamine diphosphokinase [Oscillospiraceae bacterium]